MHTDICVSDLIFKANLQTSPNYKQIETFLSVFYGLIRLNQNIKRNSSNYFVKSSFFHIHFCYIIPKSSFLSAETTL